MKLRNLYLAVSGLAVLAAAPAALAQSAAPPTQVGDAAWEDTVGAHMHMLLEKTIFKVDVLTVDVWFGDADAQRIEALFSEQERGRELERTIAEVAIHSRDAYVRLVFVRDNVSLDQFVDGIRDDLGKVPEAGIITETDYEEISANLPVWFGFLKERRIRKGDEIRYRVSGDTLRTQYVGVEGDVLLDQTDVGAVNRLSVMGSYFVEKSSFREKLIRSLVQPAS